MKTFPLFIAVLFLAVSCGTPEIPFVFDKENTASEYEAPEMPALDELPVITNLPDPLTFADGRRVKRYSQWEKRRAEILARLQHYEVGFKPQTPEGAVQARMEGDTLVVEITAGGETLTMHCPVIYPEGDGPFPAIIGIGMGGAGSLPRDIFESRGIAMISFPFWEVMSHTQKRGEEPLNRLYPDQTEIGSYAAWPWGVSRLIDGLEMVSEQSRIDLKHLAISGCSFAGKMALWAGAMDERIALTIAQEPGGGGAASWRVSETLGNVETLGRTNYSWFKESMRAFSEENVSRLPVDHHELCALIAPRALLVFGNPDYEWLADESGYVSCVAARKVWEHFGIADRMGYSFIDGHFHCMLPEVQRPELEAFVDRFLLGKQTHTDVRTAPMFEDVNVDEWISW